MLIDDEEMLLVATQRYLNAKQFRVITSKSAIEGLERIKEEKIDLLIIDILMPYISGYEFIEYLKQDSEVANIPCIFLTAKGMTEDRIKGYTMGCRAYLSKPFDPEELIAIIDNILFDRKSIENIINIKNHIQELRSKIYYFDRLNKNIKFTKREVTILLSVSKGMSNKDIAYTLGISVKNVEKYITRLLNKTSLSNRVELANYRHMLKKGE